MCWRHPLIDTQNQNLIVSPGSFRTAVDFSFVTFPINRGRCRLACRTLKMLGGRKKNPASSSVTFKMFVPLSAKLKMQCPKSHLGCYVLLM